ncbi:hypothetical protein SCYAM73S_07582 [Streptomyces cyaneofuscatus]
MRPVRASRSARFSRAAACSRGRFRRSATSRTTPCSPYSSGAAASVPRCTASARTRAATRRRARVSSSPSATASRAEASRAGWRSRSQTPASSALGKRREPGSPASLRWAVVLSGSVTARQAWSRRTVRSSIRARASWISAGRSRSSRRARSIGARQPGTPYCGWTAPSVRSSPSFTKSSRVFSAAETEQPASAEAVWASASPAGARARRRSIRAAACGRESWTSRKARASGRAPVGCWSPVSGSSWSCLVTSATEAMGWAASQPPIRASAAGCPRTPRPGSRRCAGRR